MTQLTADPDVIELGRMRSAGASATGPRHQLYFLREQGLVVMPHARMRAGWDCVVVGSRWPRTAHHLPLTDEQLAAATTTILAHPEGDPDGYARLVWLSQTFRFWPGGAPLALARYIVDGLRPPASIYVSAEALANYDSIAMRLPTTRPPAVGPLLDQLRVEGFLLRASSSLWRLTLPTETTAEQ